MEELKFHAGGEVAGTASKARRVASLVVGGEPGMVGEGCIAEVQSVRSWGTCHRLYVLEPDD